MKNSNPLVSVIIPCYNQGKYLSEAIESIISQTYPYWECIVINDGSKDDTEDIAKSYVEKDSRIRYIFQKNKGLPSARNTGITAAKGQFIQLLDSDDMIAPEKFSKQMEVFINNPKLDIVYSDYLAFDEKTPEQFYRYFEKYQIKEPYLDDFIYNFQKKFVITPNAWLFKKQCFEKWGFFDEALKNYEDFDFYITLFINQPIVEYIEGDFALYRRHENTICTNKVVLDSYRILFLKKHFKNDKLSIDLRNHLRFLFHDHFASNGYKLLRKGYVFRGIWFLAKAILISRKPIYYLRSLIYVLRNK